MNGVVNRFDGFTKLFCHVRIGHVSDIESKYRFFKICQSFFDSAIQTAKRFFTDDNLFRGIEIGLFPIVFSFLQRNRNIVFKKTAYIGNDFVENISTRPVFEYMGGYYRVDEVCFPGKPFIVIECGTYDELINNTMDEADPFPYDLTEEELMKEVKCSLGIEPYPDNN